MGKKGGSGGGGGSNSLLTWRGTRGDDQYLFTDANLGALLTTYFDGRQGSDTFDFSAITTGISVNLGYTVGQASSSVSIEQGFVGIPGSTSGLPGTISNSIYDFENIIGGSGNDWLTVSGSYVTNYVDGGAGNDYLSGGTGDILIGGTGEDWLAGQYVDVIKVGGEWDGNLSNLPGDRDENGLLISSDGAVDTFIDSGVILDFEVGIDRLLTGYNPADYDPQDPARYWVNTTWNGVPSAYLNYGGVTLVGVTAEQAMTIDLVHHEIGGYFGGPIEGWSGSDILEGGPAEDIFVIGSDGGDDIIFNFDLLADSLDFTDLPPPDTDPQTPGGWVDTSVNGQSGILYDYGSGSVTILGLNTTDADLIMMASSNLIV